MSKQGLLPHGKFTLKHLGERWYRINRRGDVRRSTVRGKGEFSDRHGKSEVLSRLCR